MIVTPWLRRVLVVAFVANAAAEPIAGTVFLDRDADGVRDPGETGLADVRISNGRDIAITDVQGRYHIGLQQGDTLFVIKPAGYGLPASRDGLPRFWQHHFPLASPTLRYGGIRKSNANGDFALLVGGPTQESFDVLLFGDPQPKSLTDVGYYERDIVAPIIGRHAAQLGLSLGDIVHDDLSLYPAMNRVTARLHLPWLNVSGNHDLDFDATRDEDALLSYRQVYGPETYAWEERFANFLILDDVLYQPDEAQKYVGGLRDDQFLFIENYLESADRGRLLIVAAHIPLFDTLAIRGSFRPDHRQRLLGLLSTFPHVLLLTSHSHMQQHFFHAADHGWRGADPLHEYNVGAACGSFWSGAADAEGIPDTTMADGTPNGYALLGIRPNAAYSLRYFVARGGTEEQIALFGPGPVRQGAYPAFGVFANVFMAAADARVEFRVDEGEWAPMQRVVGRDPRVLAENLRDATTTARRGFDRLAEAEDSTHLWRGAVPTHLAIGEHRIEVRAIDRFVGEARAATVYGVSEAE